MIKGRDMYIYIYICIYIYIYIYRGDPAGHRPGGVREAAQGLEYGYCYVHTDMCRVTAEHTEHDLGGRGLLRRIRESNLDP